MILKRKPLLTIAVIFAIVLILTLAPGVMAVADYNLMVANRAGFAQETLADGAIVQYIGDQNTTYGSSGTGVFNSFVRLQANPTEKGYNTDGTLEFDTKSGKWTHSILLSEIPTVLIGGNVYWEFFSDINDDNKTPRISLDHFELYTTSNRFLSGYPFSSPTEKIYDFEVSGGSGYILINDVNQGSGRGDLRFLVPYVPSDVPENCNYGNLACGTYLVLYSEWGGKGGDYTSDGGFEEWKVKKYPILQVSKTISGAYDTPVSWEITKDKDATYNLFTGESVVHEYEVSVDPTFGDPQNTVISGTITIHGDPDTTVNASVIDLFNGSPATISSCSVVKNLDNTYTIAAGATVTCSYTKSLATPVDGTNVATASYLKDSVSLAFQGSASILASAYVETLTGYPDINITDTNGQSWTASHESKSWKYTKTFTCDTDEGTLTNTAEITETGQQDTATVTLNCFDLTVTKTADEYYTRYFEWEITKSVSPASWNLFTGESGTSDYTVFLDRTGFHENDWQVKGTITITNNHPSRDADLTMVADVAGGLPGNANCSVMTVPAGGHIDCTYDTGQIDSLNSNPFGSTNTATARQQLYNFDKSLVSTADGTKDYTGTHAIDFTQATVKLVDDQASVSDTYNAGGVTGTFNGDHTFNYSRTFTCNADQGNHDNTASFTTAPSTYDTPLTGSDDASVTVNCYNLGVTKTADESFTRTFTWQIDKQVDNPGPITVAPGASVILNYSVVVDLLSQTDSNFQVAGNIVITNNHPSRAATLTQVSDVAGSINANVTCPPLTVPAGGSLTCTYTTAAQSSATPFGTLNTATATQQLYDFASNGTPTADGTKNYSGTHAIDFSEATISYVDEIITVTDTYAGTLGTANALTETLPKTFAYQREVTAGAAFCGEFTVDNTATFTTNDTSTTGSDSVSVTIKVPCAGCTPGFWQGGAGSILWDQVNDPQWVYGGTNPFIHTTEFNAFFNVVTDDRLDGKTMWDLVSTGGTDDWAIKAARDMVAAYLNESAFPGSYPAASLSALVTMWYDAVQAGDPGFEAFHALVSNWNSPTGGTCPLP